MQRRVLAAILATTIAAGHVAADEAALTKLLGDLTAANEARDIGKITGLLKKIQEAGKDSKEREAVDALAAELAKSLKVCKRDFNALRDVIEALGDLRSKKGESALKRIAFKKDAKDEQAEDLQSTALVALGKTANTRLLNGIADQTKNRKNTIARGAYTALGSYGTTSGKTRKKVAEVLMKRLQGEYPSRGGGKRVSPVKRQRWRELAQTIIRSLQKVCHQPEINDVANWKQWWKENKANRKAWKDKKPE